MDQAITRSSRLLGLAGLAGIIFGIAALVWPGITLVILVALFGAFALVTGVFTLVAGLDFATERASHWVPMVFAGLAGIAIGVFTFFNPGITALALVFLIAAWAILIGIFEIVTGIEFTGQVRGSWTLWLAGLLSVAFGVLIAVIPGSGAVAVITRTNRKGVNKWQTRKERSSKTSPTTSISVRRSTTARAREWEPSTTWTGQLAG